MPRARAAASNHCCPAVSEPDAPSDWIARATRIQEQLRPELVLAPPADFAPRLVAGLDVSMDRDAEVGYAAIVVLDVATLAEVDRASAVVRLGVPYVPGFLSFRELPAFEACWAKLATRPDLLVFDGQGYAHPRRFGVACHGGLVFDVPSIGCAKSILVGRHAALGTERGATEPLVHRRETVGAAVRTRSGVHPLYVSVGHRMDLDTAVEWILRLAPRFREPETTRQAHRVVNGLRRAAAPPADR